MGNYEIRSIKIVGGDNLKAFIVYWVSITKIERNTIDKITIFSINAKISPGD